MRRSAMALIVAAVVGGGCARPPPPVDLSGGWPATVEELPDATQAWTRRAVLRGPFEQTLEVFATFQAPPWLAARATERARQRGAPIERLTAEAQAAAAGDYRFTLVVTTHDRAENDLDRGERASWHVALVDAAGDETAPLTVTRDRRPASVLRAELPGFGDFATAYEVTFPRTAAALGPQVREVSLKLWSGHGAVTMTWRAR